MFVDYDYIKNHYRFKKKNKKQTKRKELDADSKVIQQKEFVEQLKNLDDAIVANGSMFF